MLISGEITICGLVVGVCSPVSGSNVGSTIQNCRATGTITDEASGTTVAGGIVGQAQSTYSGGALSQTAITRCSADVTLTTTISNGISQFGGICGLGSPLITDCYAEGTITSLTTMINTGGIIGEEWGSAFIPGGVTNCYAAITYITNDNPPQIGGFTGGKIFTPVFTYADGFWDGTIDGTFAGSYEPDDHGEDGDLANVTESTTTNMYKEATFTNWDFDTVWEIVEDVSYPTHRWLTINPHAIKTGEQNRTTAMPADYAHLNGQTIQCLGDASYLGTDVVASGTVTIDDDTTVNHVGLQYTSKLLPMKLDGEVHVKRISKIVPNFNESVGGDYGKSLSDLDSMVLRDANDPLDTDAVLYSGTVELPFDGLYDRSGDIHITQDEPLPMKLLGLGIYLSQESI